MPSKLSVPATARALAVAAILAVAATGASAQQQQRPAPAQPRAPAAGAPAAAPAAPLSSELPPKGTAVVFFDVEAVLRVSTAMQNINTQAERLRNTLQADATRQEGDLRKQEEDLANQRNVLAPEAFSQRRRDFENRVQGIQTQLQTRRRNLEQNYADAAGKVQQALTESVIEVMNEQDYQVVLPNQTIFIARSALDISGEISRKLNRRLPTAAMAN